MLLLLFLCVNSCPFCKQSIHRGVGARVVHNTYSTGQRRMEGGGGGGGEGRGGDSLVLPFLCMYTMTKVFTFILIHSFIRFSGTLHGGDSYFHHFPFCFDGFSLGLALLRPGSFVARLSCSFRAGCSPPLLASHLFGPFSKPK